MSAIQTFMTDLHFRAKRSSVALTSALTAYWKLDAAPGGITPDASGGGNDLTLVAAAHIIVGGVLNSCYSPTGVGDSVAGVAAGTKLAPTDSFTLTTWIQPGVGFTNQTAPGIAGRFESTTNLDYRLGWLQNVGFQASVVDTNGNLYILTGDTTSQDVINYTGNMSNGAWYFLAMGYDHTLQQLWLQVNNGVRYYILGVPSVRNTITNFSLGNSSTPSSGSPLIAGSDETGFWKRSLSTNEIAFLYGTGSAPPTGATWTVPPYSSFAGKVITSGGSALLSPAQRWAAQVVTNGGAAPSNATVTAMDAFYSGLVADGIANKMLSYNCIAPDSLIASLTPFLRGSGPALWINHGFVGGDLSVNGLTGDASSKYIDTGVPATVATFTNTSGGMCAYLYNNPALANTYTMGVHDATPINAAAALLCSNGGPNPSGEMWSFTGAGNSISFATSGTGFFSLQRAAANSLQLYFANSGNAHASLASNTTNQAASICTFGYPMYVFALNNNNSLYGFSAPTISFVGFTQGLSAADDALLYARVQTLRTALGGGAR